MEYGVTDRMHWQKLVRFVSRRSNPEDAEDLLQTAYLRWLERSAHSGVKNSDAYLVKTAINAGIDEARRRRYIDISVDAARLAAISDTRPGQEDIISGRQHLHQVHQILAQMKPRTRNILLMHRLDGMSYREISRNLGITQSAVEKQISRGMRVLSSAMASASISVTEVS